MGALPAVAAFAPGISWLWPCSGVCMEPRAYGKTLQQLAWGRWTEPALLGFSPVVLETLPAPKLVLAPFSFCFRQPQSHADPGAAPQRAAADAGSSQPQLHLQPLCTIRAKALVQPRASCPHSSLALANEAVLCPRGKALLCLYPFYRQGN